LPRTIFVNEDVKRTRCVPFEVAIRIHLDLNDERMAIPDDRTSCTKATGDAIALAGWVLHELEKRDDD
jgi:hypothetical protein